MKYMLTWTVKPENQHESNARWKAAGPNPPEGIEVLNHYWNDNNLNGWSAAAFGIRLELSLRTCPPSEDGFLDETHAGNRWTRVCRTST